MDLLAVSYFFFQMSDSDVYVFGCFELNWVFDQYMLSGQSISQRERMVLYKERVENVACRKCKRKGKIFKVRELFRRDSSLQPLDL